MPKSRAAQEVKHALECRCDLSRVIRKPSLRRRLNRDMKDEKEAALQGVKGRGRRFQREEQIPTPKTRSTRLPDLGAEHRTKWPCIQAARI